MTAFMRAGLRLALASALATTASVAPPLGMTITGRVLLSNGAPASGHRVTVFCMTPLFLGESEPTASDGGFVVRDVPAGECSVEAADPTGYTCTFVGGHHLDPTETYPCSETSKKLQVQPGQSISGVVLAAPVPDPDLMLPPTTVEGTVVSSGELPAGLTVAAACTQPDGSKFDVATYQAPDLAPGQFRCEIHAPTGTVCLLRAYGCGGGAGCERPECTEPSEKCVRIEAQAGAGISGVRIRF